MQESMHTNCKFLPFSQIRHTLLLSLWSKLVLSSKNLTYDIYYKIQGSDIQKNFRFLLNTTFLSIPSSFLRLFQARWVVWSPSPTARKTSLWNTYCNYKKGCRNTLSKYRRKKQQLLTAFDELFHTFSPSDKINVVKCRKNKRKDNLIWHMWFIKFHLYTIKTARF